MRRYVPRVLRHSIAARLRAMLVGLLLTGCGSTAPRDAVPTTAPLVREGTLADVVGPWQQVPFRLPPGATVAADRACRESIGIDFPADAELAVVDARGGRVVQLWYAGPNGASASCSDVELQADGSWAALGGTGAGHMGNGWPELGATDIVLTDNGSSGRPITRSYLAGRLGSDIATVRLLLPGQLPLQATVGNGWWGAWVNGEFPARTVIQGLNAAGEAVGEANLID